jgi:hypothetical protein
MPWSELQRSLHKKVWEVVKISSWIFMDLAEKNCGSQNNSF